MLAFLKIKKYVKIAIKKDEKIYIYQVTTGKQETACLDDGEFLTVEFVPLQRAKAMLKNGEIHDAKTIVALQAYFLQ